jgi:protoporphyrinogen oxidase
MREYIYRRGTIHLRTPIERICVVDGRVVAIRAGGCELRVDHVISSMPIRRLLQSIGAPPSVLAEADGLRTRHVALVHLHVEASHPMPHTWVYVYDRALAVGRIVDNRAWQGTDSRGRGVITMEYWCGQDDAIWTAADAELIDRARQELATTRMVPGASILNGDVTRLPNALPVPARGAPATVRRLGAEIASIEGLSSVGRHGEFAYNSMALSIDSGIKAATRAFEQGARR